MNKSTPNTIQECKHCKMDIAIRNPSGYCDHLNYPEYCKVCSKPTPTPTSTIQEIEHLLLHLVHVYDNGKIYTLPEDDSMTYEEIKKSNLYNWGNGTHFNGAVQRIYALFLKDKKRIIKRIEGLSPDNYMDCSEYRTGSAKFHACIFYNKELFEFNQKITQLLVELRREG